MFFVTIYLKVVFRRYLQPEKDYLSFSLVYNNGERTLDLVRKHIDSAFQNSQFNEYILNMVILFLLFIDMQRQS